MKTINDLVWILVLSGLFFFTITAMCFMLLVYEIRMNKKRDDMYKDQLDNILKKVTDLVNEIKK